MPAGLYNGMVAAATDFRIKGVIWYQGESNSRMARANMYEREFEAMIQDWRSHWQEGAFPFLFVQISSFLSTSRENWPVVREAQRRTLGLANTGMAVTIDIGDPTNVHPANKQDVGARLALLAEHIAYGKNVEDTGPLFREATISGSAIRVWFDHADTGLKVQGSELKGFEVAGEDRQFAPAQGRIDGSTVVLTSDAIREPRYVRYGWQNAPEVNLFNGAGLPASPFTSEQTIPSALEH
jgi:sialate O-acetylesterase